MKKLLFAIFLFISCAVMAGMPDANCPADRPLADWDGKCYSCDEDKDLYSVNGPCKEVCPNRMHLSSPMPAPDWAGCVLDTPGNRITNFVYKYVVTLFLAFIPIVIMSFYLLGIPIRWCYRKLKSKILALILWCFIITAAVKTIPGVIPLGFIFVYVFCLFYDIWDICQIIKETRSKDKKVKKEAIKSSIALGLYGV